MQKKIKDIKRKIIDIDKLYFQYIPNEFLKDVYPGGEEDMLSLINSPHYRFLELYNEIGKKIWNNYKETDYIKLMKFWGRDDKYNRQKVAKFIKTYNSIRKRGLQKRIVVLNKPMYKKFFLDGYEIYHGHHRASICKFLEYKKVPCVISVLVKKPKDSNYGKEI